MVLFFSFWLTETRGQQLPTATAAEICDNGIDDDNDGYVDCYDTDCHCFSGTDCSVTELPSDFRARLAWQSAQNGPSITAVPVVANMNPHQDSMPEIIVAAAAANGSSLANRILFFRGDGSNLANPLVLTIPSGFDPYPVPGPTVGDINNDGIPELIMSCNDRRIRVFRNYTETPGAPMTLWVTSSGQLDYTDQKPYFADFDGDGIPEIYAGSDVFEFNLTNPANPTLNKVINGPGYIGQAMYSVYQEGSCSPTAVDLLSVADCNGDPDCAGLELVAGPAIYSIDLDPNDGDGYQIKIKRDLNLMAPGNAFGDGYTAVADVDLDGVLDVVVSARRNNTQTGVYVWNKNGFLRFFPYPGGNSRSGSLACIANLYDDRTNGYAQDFPEILVCNAYNLNCFNLQAALTTPATPYWWSLVTEDYSGFTGSSVYDFNGDGLFEIVYRDEDNFRILYGGAAPFPPGVDAERNWFKIPCGSITSDEYPIVADVDNDGETEIAVTGYTFSGYNNPSSDYRGRLRVFESDAEPWVPCRNVWNQYNYFVVNVNDDLSIPAQQQLHHLELPAAGSGNRPLNRYLSQRPLLDENFQPFLPVPDALASVTEIVCADDKLYVQLQICNDGSHPLKNGTPVAFYTSDPTTTGAPLLGNVQFTDAKVEPGECRPFLFLLPALPGKVYGVVSDDGTKARPFNLALDFPATTQIECNYPNNIFQFEFEPAVEPFDLGPDYISCNDTVIVLRAGAGHLGYQWQDGSTDSVLVAQKPGLYWVEVSDYCLAPRIDSVRIEKYTSLQITLDTINGDCLGNPAQATVTAGSPYLPLTYLWSEGSESPIIAGVPDGVYTVSVTDAKGCRSVDSTWVEAGGLLLVEPAVTGIPCAGQTGLINLLLVTGKAPLTFQWSTGAEGSNLQDVPAGEYSVVVSDADGCSQTLQISMPEPTALQSSGLIAEAACPGESNGAVSFAGATQGTPPYSLLWSTSSDLPGISGVLPGSYTLTVSDANGCTLVETAVVPEFEPPSVTGTASNVTCFGANDGTLSVTLSGGTPGFGYLWSNGGTGPDIQHLPPGAYSLALTYADGKCAQQVDFQISEPPLLFSAGIAAEPACPGETNGSAAFLGAAQGTPPYTLHWNDGSDLPLLDGLAAGAYSMTLTDANGCSLMETVQIPEYEAPEPVDTIRDVTCFGDADGRIAVGVLGGTPGFGYFWSNNVDAPAIQNLGPGIYTLSLTYADGKCARVFDYQIQEPLPLLSAGIVTEPACPGEANGSVLFSGALQGTPPYTLLWASGSDSAGLSGLPSGQYQLTITDTNGCTVSDTAEVPVFETPVIQAETSDVPCFGEANGVISVSLTGDSAGFGYLWSNNATSPEIQNLSPGHYPLTLTYADGKCRVFADFVITEPTALLLLDSQITPIRCFGDKTGAIDITPGGGTAPYQFDWSDGRKTEDIGALTAGDYALTLTDAHGCVMQAPFYVAEPEKLDIQAGLLADTCQSANGALTVQAAGGVSPYQFLWSTGASVPGISGLPAGSYGLTLTDANDCQLAIPFEVPAWGEIPLVTPFTDTITCAQPGVWIGVTADQNDLNYFWSGPGGGLPGQPSNTVFVAGIYQVQVVNPYGCTASAQLEVLENRVFPVADAGAEYLIVPCGETSAALDAGASSAGSLFLNKWILIKNGVAVFDTTALKLAATQPGLYVHRVVNLENGCAAQDSVLVAWAAPLAAAVSVDSVTCFGANDGIIRLELLSGGTPPVYYSIDNQNFTANNTYYELPPGSYPVSVRDNYGCVWESIVWLREPDSLAVDLIAGDTVVQIGAYVELEALPFPPGVVLQTIIWQPGGFDFIPNALTQNIRPTDSTVFAVTIVDAHGCVATDRLAVAVNNFQIYVPNVIHPGTTGNGWFTIFAGEGVREILLMRIYDRWGNFVFENRHFQPNVLTDGWDGTFRGGEMNPGVFVWYAEIELRDGQRRLLKGDVTVLR